MGLPVRCGLDIGGHPGLDGECAGLGCLGADNASSARPRPRCGASILLDVSQHVPTPPAQLPKPKLPKWAARGLKAKALLSTPPGLWARRVAVAAHLSLIIRCASGCRLSPSWLFAQLHTPGGLSLLRPATCSPRPSQLPASRRAAPACRPACCCEAPLLPCQPATCFPAGPCPGHLLCREVWRNLYVPGTFRGVLRNAWRTLTTGARFEWPQPGAARAANVGAASGELGAAAVADSLDSWHITTKDLAHFKWTIGEEGASKWEPMMQKQWPGCTYTAWRRTLPGGKSEYKSVTISGGARGGGGRHRGRLQGCKRARRRAAKLPGCGSSSRPS